MSEVIAVSLALTADARNVHQARQVLRGALLRSGAEHLVDAATLVLSEIITNAFVRAGIAVRLHIWSLENGVRVEVEEDGTQLPTQPSSAETAATAQGLQLLDALADRWGTSAHETAKTVWFEVGEFDADAAPDLGAHHEAGTTAPHQTTRAPGRGADSGGRSTER